MCLFIIIALFLLYPLIELFNVSTEAGVIGVFVYILIFVMLYVWGQKQLEEEQEKKEEAKKNLANLKAEAESRLDARIQAVAQKYGNPDKLIKLNEYRYIAVFAKFQILCISDTEIAFNEILSAKVIDNYQIEHGQIKGDATTTTSTSSLVGRSAAGALIGGGVGAAIGASSASKNTTVNYTQSNDKLIHDYVLIITLNRFNSSIIKVRIGNNWERATEIEHIFNLINMHNQQSAQ